MDNMSTKKLIILILVTALISFSTGYYISYDKFSTVNSGIKKELEDFKSLYKNSILEKEAAIIAKAKAESKKPETIYIGASSTSDIVYKEKENVNDPDVKINSSAPSLKLQYNSKIYDLNPIKTNNQVDFKGGTLVANQKAEFNLNITDVVNREINYTLMQKDKEIAILKRQKNQNLFWGIIGGAATGAIIKQHF